MSVTECPRCGGPIVKYTDRVNYQCTQCYVIILAEEDFYRYQRLAGPLPSGLCGDL